MHRLRRFMYHALLVLLMTSALTVPIGSTGAQEEANPPVLTGAWVTTVEPCMVVVHGTHFTPDGKVFIAMLDPWGEQAYETRWTSASAGTLDADRSIQPSTAFDLGGVVYETFGPICGHQIMVRAFDQGKNEWTNVDDIVVTGGTGQIVRTG